MLVLVLVLVLVLLVLLLLLLQVSGSRLTVSFRQTSVGKDDGTATRST